MKNAELQIPACLRRATENDTDQIVKWMLSKRYAEFCQFTPVSTYSYRLGESIRHSIRTGASHYYLLNSRSDGSGETVGFFCLSDFDSVRKRAEISVFSSVESGSLSYFKAFSKACFWINDYAFFELGLRKLGAEILENNHRSIHLSTGFGYKIEGICRRKIFRAGTVWNTFFLGLLKEEWISLRSGRLRSKERSCDLSEYSKPTTAQISSPPDEDRRVELHPLLPEDTGGLVQLLSTDTAFLSKNSFSGNEDLEKWATRAILTHPRKILHALTDSEGVRLGFSMLAHQGFPHSFGAVSLCLAQKHQALFKECVLAACHYSFHELGLGSLQISLLAEEQEGRVALKELGWTLDAHLKQERRIEDQWVDELRFGRINQEGRGT